MENQKKDDDDSGACKLVQYLEPSWQPNDVIKVFHEERHKVEQRGLRYKNLLRETDEVLKQSLALKDLYRHISPNSQLHSECKNIIQERNEISEMYEKINVKLSQVDSQPKQTAPAEPTPDLTNYLLNTLNSVCRNFLTLAIAGPEEPATISQASRQQTQTDNPSKYV